MPATSIGVCVAGGHQRRRLVKGGKAWRAKKMGQTQRKRSNVGARSIRIRTGEQLLLGTSSGAKKRDALCHRCKRDGLHGRKTSPARVVRIRPSVADTSCLHGVQAVCCATDGRTQPERPLLIADRYPSAANGDRVGQRDPQASSGQLQAGNELVGCVAQGCWMIQIGGGDAPTGSESARGADQLLLGHVRLHVNCNAVQ